MRSPPGEWQALGLPTPAPRVAFPPSPFAGSERAANRRGGRRSVDFLMLLADLVITWRRVSATRSRSEKIAVLADLLRRLRPEEIEIASALIAGGLRQGRIGLGPAAVRAAMDAAPAAPAAAVDGASASTALTLREVDAAFSAIAAASGSGSAAERVQRLGALLGAATVEERELLVRLIFGELRQGALAGLAVEALAAAAEVPADEGVHDLRDLHGARGAH